MLLRLFIALGRCLRLFIALGMLTLGFAWFSFVSLREGKTREALETAPVALLFAGITVFVVRRQVGRLRDDAAAAKARSRRGAV